MVVLFIPTDIVCLYDGTDREFGSVSKQMRKINEDILRYSIEKLPYETGYKIVCDEDSINLAYRISGYFGYPVTIKMGDYQYSSACDFWRNYVRTV